MTEKDIRKKIAKLNVEIYALEHLEDHTDALDDAPESLQSYHVYTLALKKMELDRYHHILNYD